MSLTESVQEKINVSELEKIKDKDGVFVKIKPIDESMLRKVPTKEFDE